MKTQHKHLLQRTYLVLVFGFMYHKVVKHKIEDVLGSANRA